MRITNNLPLLALCTMCLLLLLLIWIWPLSYLTLTVDDSFYYLKTAMNIAEGHGATFDQINPTNGFHPLWMGTLALVALANDQTPHFLMNVALSIQVVFVLVGSICLSRADPLSERRYSLIVAILLMNFYFAKILINGQESALQYLLLCASLAFWWKYCSVSCEPGNAFLLGSLAGLCTLARLEAVFFGVTTLAMPLIWPSDVQRSQPPWARARIVAIGLVTFGLVVIPYLIWNLVNFDHLVPVSGAIKSNIRVFPSLRGIVISLVVAVGLLLYWLLGRRSLHQGRNHRVECLRYLFPLTTYVALQTVYTAGICGRLTPGIWYVVPHLILGVLIITGLVRFLNRFQSLWLRRLFMSVLLFAHLLFAGVVWQFRLDPISYSPKVIKQQVSLWIRKNTPEDALLAGWNAGILGAHSERRFINLDGLINSWEYKEQYLDRGRVAEFINDVHPVDYVAEYQDMNAVYRRWQAERATIEGIDFASWYVAYARFGRFRSVASPWNTRPLIHLVLSRQPCETCRYRFDDFVALAAGEYASTGEVKQVLSDYE
jgi:hypothetical protein